MNEREPWAELIIALHPDTGDEIKVVPRDLREWLMLRNAVHDPTYGPYCLRCSTMERMTKLRFLVWACRRCGARQDSESTVTVTSGYAGTTVDPGLDEKLKGGV